ncbi:peptidoglycan DD-metalloendopeptidase family protein [Acidobacteriota bacterium]
MKVHIKVKDREERSHYLFMSLLIVGFLTIFLILSFLPKDYSAKPSLSAENLKQPLPPKPEVKENVHLIERGKTLTDILPPYGFSPQDIYKLRQDVRDVYDLAKIKAGHELRVYTTIDGDVLSLEYEIDNESFVHIKKTEETYVADIVKYAFDLSTHMIWGEIEDNPISAVQKAGEKQYLALMLSEIFAWDIDFYLDLRKGDTFRILFEKKYLEDEFVGYGRILAAEFTNQKKTFQAFRFTSPDTKKSDYYSYNGDSMKRDFLKSPIPYSSRITSRFSYGRLHPIRKVVRAHLGVDYASPVGTPVQATASGTVTFAGWNGASGRMVRVKHKNRFETMYLHLRRFGSGIKNGKKVGQGDVVGYVGSSGESTGPHLDYRVRENGRYINPLSYKFRPTEPLNKIHLADFQQNAELYQACFIAPLILARSITHPTSYIFHTAIRPAGSGD